MTVRPASARSRATSPPARPASAARRSAMVRQHLHPDGRRTTASAHRGVYPNGLATTLLLAVRHDAPPTASRPPRPTAGAGTAPGRRPGEPERPEPVDQLPLPAGRPQRRRHHYGYDYSAHDHQRLEPGRPPSPRPSSGHRATQGQTLTITTGSWNPRHRRDLRLPVAALDRPGTTWTAIAGATARTYTSPAPTSATTSRRRHRLRTAYGSGQATTPARSGRSPPAPASTWHPTIGGSPRGPATCSTPTRPGARRRLLCLSVEALQRHGPARGRRSPARPPSLHGRAADEHDLLEVSSPRPTPTAAPRPRRRRSAPVTSGPPVNTVGADDLGHRQRPGTERVSAAGTAAGTSTPTSGSSRPTAEHLDEHRGRHRLHLLTRRR